MLEPNPTKPNLQFKTLDFCLCGWPWQVLRTIEDTYFFVNIEFCINSRFMLVTMMLQLCLRIFFANAATIVFHLGIFRIIYLSLSI